MRCVNILILITFMLCAACTNSQLIMGEKSSEPFPEFAVAKLYQMNWSSGDPMMDLVYDGKLNPDRQPLDGIILTDAQADLLIAAITGEFSRGAAAACYWPHHGFEFLDGNGERVGAISVCFKCRNHHSHISGTSSVIDIDALERLVKSMGVPIRRPDW